ncbi:MAG: DinB family protein [Phycisphaerae bacterium]|jgi:hypothetical protein
MTAKEATRSTIEFCHHVTISYLDNLTDAELLVRSVPGTNHIAWQLGHLITSEQHMIAAIGDEMPALPEGFAEAHSPESATSDDPAKFLAKDGYLALMEKMRAGTLAALAARPEADFDKPAPESMRAFAATIGAVYMMIGAHELMHAGQFVPIRRKLGRKPLF